MNFKNISYEKRGRSGWLYLNRPENMNSINTEMAMELVVALLEAGADMEVRVILLSGKGPSFCAGADLKSLVGGKGTQVAGPDFLDRARHAFSCLRNFPKPVIAVVNGLALAGGLELVMCCDIVIASESAKLGDAHSNYGVFPGAGGAAVMPRKIGLNRAKHLLFTGEFVSAEKMREYGLVNQVVPPEMLEDAAQALADLLAEKSPLVLRRMKEVANRSLDQAQDAALRHELLELRDHMRSLDFQEGLAAFKEKRPPNFTGE